MGECGHKNDEHPTQLIHHQGPMQTTLEHIIPPPHRVITHRGWLVYSDEDQSEESGLPAFSVRCTNPRFGVICSMPELLPEICDKKLMLLVSDGYVDVWHDDAPPEHPVKMLGDWACILEYEIDGEQWNRVFLMDGNFCVNERGEQRFMPLPGWVLSYGGSEQ